MISAAQGSEAVLGGAIDVTREPESEEEAARVWQFKKTMVEGLATRVDVRPNKPIKITVELDLERIARWYMDR